MINVKLEKLISLISKSTTIKINELNIDSCANDFAQWDSLAHLRIMLEIQKMYKIKISTSKMSELNSVKSILFYLK
jgi:acyl carrier protein